MSQAIFPTPSQVTFNFVYKDKSQLSHSRQIPQANEVKSFVCMFTCYFLLSDDIFEFWLWCGVVWRGVAWCGVVWRGVAWCGVVWRGVVWFVYNTGGKCSFTRLNIQLQSGTVTNYVDTYSIH